MILDEVSIPIVLAPLAGGASTPWLSAAVSSAKRRGQMENLRIGGRRGAARDVHIDPDRGWGQRPCLGQLLS